MPLATVSLEHLVARANLRAGFERVRANAGCRGADGVTIGDFADELERELDSLEVSLRSGRYQPFPLLEIRVPKRAGGERRLAIPTVRDRVAQAAFYEVTRDLFEAERRRARSRLAAGGFGDLLPGLRGGAAATVRAGRS